VFSEVTPAIEKNEMSYKKFNNHINQKFTCNMYFNWPVICYMNLLYFIWRQ